MRIIPFILGISLLSLNACVSKSDYEKLEKEKIELETQLEETKNELSNVRYKYDQLNEEKIQAEIERNKTPYISEDQALQYIKDNYAFYEKDITYRNVQLRRISDNSFRVSLETCTKKGSFSDDDFFWHSSVRTLTVHKNGKYDF